MDEPFFRPGKRVKVSLIASVSFDWFWFEDDDEIMAFISATDAANSIENKVKAEIMDAISEETKTKTTVKKKKKTKAKKKKKKTKTVKAKEETPPETPPEIPVEILNPWGELKQSTLQRKTIAQLTAYLEERVSYYNIVTYHGMIDHYNSW